MRYFDVSPTNHGFSSILVQINQFLTIMHHLPAERPFIDILQDRRYWVIHLLT